MMKSKKSRRSDDIERPQQWTITVRLAAVAAFLAAILVGSWLDVSFDLSRHGEGL
jgi:hypothetical protein